MIDLSGRRVLVTGGSRGIGAACCRLFARAGASVCIHYFRSEEQARDVANEIEREGLSKPLLAAADLRNPDDAIEMGVYLERYIRRKNELANWPTMSRDYDWFSVSQYGSMSGLVTCTKE